MDIKAEDHRYIQFYNLHDFSVLLERCWNEEKMLSSSALLFVSWQEFGQIKVGVSGMLCIIMEADS